MNIDYDLNIDNNDNQFEKTIELLNRDINVKERYIEMKEIEDIDLYRKMPDGTTQIVSSVTANEVKNNLSQYIVKVRMKYLPAFYAPIKEVIDGDELRFKLDYDMVAQYEGYEVQDGIIVSYGKLDGGVYKNETFASFVEKLKNNKNKNSGKVTLTKNLDAAGYTGGTATYILDSFSGEIDGGGYTIYNLSKPLFGTFNGSMSFLTFENVSISAQLGAICYGGIANDGSGTFTSVQIKNMSQFTHWGFDGYGGFIGRGSGSFEYCSITNFNMSGEGEKVGGFIGKASGNVTIKDCYITGSITTTGSGANRRMIAGGFIGSAEGSATITNSYAKVDMNCQWGPGGNGGIIGEGTNAVLTNCLSLGTGSNAFTIAGAKVSPSSRNNYELTESTLKTNSDNSYLTTNKVDKAGITSTFFANLGYGNWDYRNASYEN